MVAPPAGNRPVSAFLAAHTDRPPPGPDLAPWLPVDSLKCARRGADYEAVAPSTLPSYDPRVIEQFAEKLYRKASAFVAGSVVIGGALGAGFGEELQDESDAVLQGPGPADKLVPPPRRT